MKLLSGEEAAQAVASLAHRYASFDPAVEKTVAGIVNHVRTGGDAALLEYAHKLDGLAEGEPVRVSEKELRASLEMVSAVPLWVLTVVRPGMPLPVMVQPNAGLPVLENMRAVYKQLPADMAAEVPKAIAAGANIIGSCCGSTPEHTRAIRAAVEQFNRAG